MGTTSSAKNSALIESVQRIEPARLDAVPEAISNIVAELAAAAAKPVQTPHPCTAANMAAQARVTNSE
jgi:hypothetical protein